MELIEQIRHTAGFELQCDGVSRAAMADAAVCGCLKVSCSWLSIPTRDAATWVIHGMRMDSASAPLGRGQGQCVIGVLSLCAQQMASNCHGQAFMQLVQAASCTHMNHVHACIFSPSTTPRTHPCLLQCQGLVTRLRLHASMLLQQEHGWYEQYIPYFRVAAGVV